MSKKEDGAKLRKSVKAEARESRERARVMTLAEEDNILFAEDLKARLKTQYGIDMLAFPGKSGSTLPTYTLAKNGKCLAVADVLYGKLEDYIKIPAARFKNGLFCAEIFGVPGEDPAKVGKVKYCIFLLGKGGFHRWTYNDSKKKPYPTLTDEKEGLLVAIKRDEFDPVGEA